MIDLAGGVVEAAPEGEDRARLEALVDDLNAVYKRQQRLVRALELHSRGRTFFGNLPASSWREILPEGLPTEEPYELVDKVAGGIDGAWAAIARIGSR